MERQAIDLAHAFSADLLARIDITLPPWAMEINDLVSIEDKIHWSQHIVPTLLAKIAIDPIEAKAWLREQLDPASIELLKPGIIQLIESDHISREPLLACFHS
jgi:hypothetical protein